MGEDALIAIVRCDSVAQRSPEEARSAGRFAGNLAEMFGELGLGCVTLAMPIPTAQQVAKARAGGASAHPQPARRRGRRFASAPRSGRQASPRTVCPTGCVRLLESRPARSPERERPGQFSTIRFADGALPGAPAVVGQASWNIVEPRPVLVLAWCWPSGLMPRGSRPGRNAVVASSNCVEMSHVLLPDDHDNKRRMLLPPQPQVIGARFVETIRRARPLNRTVGHFPELG